MKRHDLAGTRLDSTRLIRMEPILRIVQAVIWSGRVSGETPISLCIIARQESAKSQAILYFSNTPTLKCFSDVTAKPLANYRRDIEAGRLRHIVLLDLVRVMTHGKGVAARTLQYLAGLMEEGQATTADAGGTEDWIGMPKVGVIMAVTPAYWHKSRAGWKATGFITRFLRLWFEYSSDTRDLVHSAISNGSKLPDPINEPLPKDSQIVTLNQDHADAIMQLAVAYASVEDTYGFRYHRQMRALAKALALLDGKTEVGDKHVRQLLAWQRFFTGQNPVTL